MLKQCWLSLLNFCSPIKVGGRLMNDECTTFFLDFLLVVKLSSRETFLSAPAPAQAVRFVSCTPLSMTSTQMPGFSVKSVHFNFSELSPFKFECKSAHSKDVYPTPAWSIALCAICEWHPCCDQLFCEGHFPISSLSFVFHGGIRGQICGSSLKAIVLPF